MAKEKTNLNKLKKPTIYEILSDIKARLGHLEDIGADNRAIIIKLVKQGNDIVNVLRNLEMEVIEEEQIDNVEMDSYLSSGKTKDSAKYKHIKELVDEYMDKAKDLKELEKELKKHKDQITPGQIGDA